MRALVAWMEPVGLELSAPVLRERLLTAPVAAMPVRGTDGQVLGVVTASTLGERWRRAGGESMVAALADLVPAVSPDMLVGEALSAMDTRSVDALPVQGEDGQVGGGTRVGLERFLRGARRKPRAEPAFSATEIPR